MDQLFQTRLIHAFTSNSNHVYDMLYLYGTHKNTAEFIDTLTKQYVEQHPASKIIRTTSESFKDETIRIVVSGERFSVIECDLFVLDGISELAGMEANEQRLYGILDWLIENKRQVVIVGDVPVAQIIKLAPRICAQINGGISCALNEET